ncbi:MarR family winged helix-turn-helix transcriptional regulator [Dysgonomonas sp. ZJ709]|uniref:MarR family winged helix-turn-helix transcriptional regulator n=1 Tax=Dysgonomonas sp. ZJ709 TaxID=2709797 RepID=UPI0013EAEE1F|nr:MarR family transcriptional regulator [Dysgonomonas sp. ZJ709]
MDEFYSLGFLLNRASVSMSKLLNARLESEAIDLPHSQFIVLRCLHYKDGLSQQEIARLLCKDAAAIKRTIDNLEKKELVARSQVSQRENCINITSKGQELIPTALECGDNVLKDSLKDIEDIDYEKLKTLLDKIYMNIEEISQ